MRTGKLVWTFHSVPRAGEQYNDTWEGDSWKNRSGVNVWGLMTVDVQRGIVYMPFGAPAKDRYGGDRRATICSAPAWSRPMRRTGKYLWHFQVVHHDIWDADVANPPMLLDVRQDGKTIPAVGGHEQERSAVLAGPRHRQADLRRRGATGPAERNATGADGQDAAVSAQAARRFRA